MHEHSAGNLAIFHRILNIFGFQYSEIFFLFENLQRFRFKIGRDDDFGKNFIDGIRFVCTNFIIKSDDAAECRNRIGF